MQQAQQQARLEAQQQQQHQLLAQTQAMNQALLGMVQQQSVPSGNGNSIGRNSQHDPQIICWVVAYMSEMDSAQRNASICQWQ